jgi:hypothetical protein
MDPISIVKSVKDLIELCFKVSDFINGTTTVDANFRLLGSEVRVLSEVLVILNDSIGNVSNRLETGHDKDLWPLVMQSMDDCKETLTTLGRIAEENSTRDSEQMLRLPRMQWQWTMQKSEIREFQTRITAFKNTMQIALQLITMFVEFYDFTD